MPHSTYFIWPRGSIWLFGLSPTSLKNDFYESAFFPFSSHPSPPITLDIQFFNCSTNNGTWSQDCVCVLVAKSKLVAGFFVTPWTVACQALSMGFPRQEHRSGLPFPSLGDLPHPGIKPRSCNIMDCSLSGSSVHGMLQARILEWVIMPFFRGSSRPRDQTHISYVSCIGR